MTRQNRISLGLGVLVSMLAGAQPSSAHVGKWRSFTYMGSITALIDQGGYLYAGTTGGVRRINLATREETQYTNMEGLADVRIAAFAKDSDNKIWAASRSGLLFRLDGEKWSAWGRAYKSQGWIINPRAFLSAGDYLVIGSEKGLSFFDRKSGMAKANLVRFGKEGAQSITGMLRVGDTLYIATGKTVMKAAVDWQNLMSSKFGLIADPQIWTTAEGIQGPPRNPIGKDSTGDTVVVDTTEGRPVQLALLDGKIVAHDLGTVLTSPFLVKTMAGRPFVFDSEVYPQTTVLEVALAVGNKVFLGGLYGLLIFDPNSGISDIPVRNGYPRDPIASIAALGDKVVALSASGVYQLQGTEWRLLPHGGWGYTATEFYLRDMKSLTMDKGGDVYLGHWGEGLVKMTASEKRRWHSGNSCLSAAGDNAYTVVNGISDILGDDMWITQFQPGPESEITTHKLAHLDLRTGEVACSETLGRGQLVYGVRILNDSLFAVAGRQGLFIYRFGKGGKKSDMQLVNSVRTGVGSEIAYDMALDGRNRLWVLINDKVGYVDSLTLKAGGTESIQASFPDAITAKSCHALERDVLDGVWVGCLDGLFHVQYGSGGQPLVRKYTTEDGLLADRILDISVDKSDGRVWIATENGVSMLESGAQPTRSGLDGVKAYPNPFREKHSFLILDRVPKDATATIFTESGYAVRHFRWEDAQGNQFQWDGTNAAGKKVTPGIYMYTVTSGLQSARGKIIVAR